MNGANPSGRCFNLGRSYEPTVRLTLPSLEPAWLKSKYVDIWTDGRTGGTALHMRTGSLHWRLLRNNEQHGNAAHQWPKNLLLNVLDWPLYEPMVVICDQLDVRAAALQKEERQRKTNTQRERGANAPLVFSFLKTVISAVTLTPRILLQALLRSQLLSNCMTHFFYQIQHKTLRKKNRRRYFNWSKCRYIFENKKRCSSIYSILYKCVQFTRSRTENMNVDYSDPQAPHPTNGTKRFGFGNPFRIPL